MAMLTAHPCVRLRPPGGHHPTKWVAEHLSNRTRVAIAPIGAAVLIAAFDSIKSTTEAVESLAQEFGAPATLVRGYIKKLYDLRMIVDMDDHERFRLLDFFSNWARYGWFSSADYHVATYDYGFADYEEGGRKLDLDRMSSYAKSNADTNRFKSYPSSLVVTTAGLPNASRIPATLIDVFQRQVPCQELTCSMLFDLLAMVFGKVREMRLISPGASPVLCRTSPSGGSRHPTEGYVAVHSIKGLEPGWYHYCSDSGDCELIRGGSSETELRETFYGVWPRAPFAPRAVVLMTSVFSRNMYRYREPRTFRSIHMDVGHLVGSLLLFSRALGIKAFAHCALDETAVEQVIGAAPLTEGAMFSVAVG
jgi:SagB-type dehydrogenase family enzyme